MIILEYHRVNPVRRGTLSVHRDEFRRQLRYLLEQGYKNVALEDIAGRLHGGIMPLERSFAITFDDGYRDNYLHALPVLQELGLRATIFVTVNYLDTCDLFPWESLRQGEGGTPAEEDLPLTWTQVKEMQASGVFQIGSHTLTHPFLTMIDRQAAQREIALSKQILEQRLGELVTTFCYPAGYVNREIIGMVRDAGYTLGVVTPQVPVPLSRYTLRRIGLYENTDLRSLQRRTSLPYQFLLQAGLLPGITQVLKNKRIRSGKLAPAR